MHQSIQNITNNVSRLHQCLNEANFCAQQISQEIRQLSFGATQSMNQSNYGYASTGVQSVMAADRGQNSEYGQTGSRNWGSSQQFGMGSYGATGYGQGMSQNYSSGNIRSVMQADHQGTQEGSYGQSSYGGQYGSSEINRAGVQNVLNADRSGNVTSLS